MRSMVILSIVCTCGVGLLWCDRAGASDGAAGSSAGAAPAASSAPAGGMSSAQVAPAANGNGQSHGNGHHGGGRHRHHFGGHHQHHHGAVLGYGWPGYWSYGGLYGGTYAPGWYGSFYDPWWDGFVLPPLVIPAEAMYGPQALANFLGYNSYVNVPSALPVDPVIIKRVPREGGFGVLAPQAAGGAQRPKVRVSNARARARAWQLLDAGDAQFAGLKFTDALQRYKKAASAAPDLATPYFRQGVVLSAMGRYEAAVKALKRGFLQDAQWPRSGFDFTEFYGDNRLSRTSHLERLAQAAAARPEDGDLFFLLGVWLFFDGEHDKSRTFIVRARQLGFDAPDAVAEFLREIERAVEPQKAAAEKDQGQEI